MDQKNTIALMGGSFDPIHLGHIKIADAARKALGIEKVLFLPSGRPPHKAHLGAGAKERLNMTVLATADYPWAEACDIEVFREGTIYTVDTLTLLKKQYPDTEFVYFIGADTLLDLKNWKNTQIVATLCSFACVRRPGINDETMEAEKAYLLDRFSAKVTFVDAVGPEISSTLIRENVKNGRSTDGMLAPAVRAYIDEKKLYQ